MFKYTKTTLQKIETIFEELDYKVRYEKGSFKSGYCLVENRNIAVVNKFFDTEGRINVLLEILSAFEDVDESLFTEKTLDFYKKIIKTLDKKEVGEEKEEIELSEEVVVENGNEGSAK
jgi:activator of HSP90 ATPase